MARRWQSFKFTSQIGVEFNPNTFQQLAGIVCYYNTENWIYLFITLDEEVNKRRIGIIHNDTMKFKEYYLDEKNQIEVSTNTNQEDKSSANQTKLNDENKKDETNKNKDDEEVKPDDKNEEDKNKYNIISMLYYII